MKKRFKVRKKKSRRLYRKGSRTKSLNRRTVVMRGGIRL